MRKSDGIYNRNLFPVLFPAAAFRNTEGEGTYLLRIGNKFRERAKTIAEARQTVSSPLSVPEIPYRAKKLFFTGKQVKNTEIFI